MIGLLVGLWLLVELLAQLHRLGIERVWHVKRLPGRRNGLTLHPLLILVETEWIVPHERVHAEQMARLTWLGFLLLYLLSGRKRVALEAEAELAHWYDYRSDDPDEEWIEATARRITGATYFPRPFAWQDPGAAFARTMLRHHVRQ